MKRPTVGDFVQVVANDLMKRYAPNEVGKVFKIIKDDGGSYPYRLARCEARHWFSENDIKWPDLDNKPVKRKKASSLEKPVDMPRQVMIMQDRYGCQAGELIDVKGQTGDQQSWILIGGKQVPKAHEGVGWSRVEPQDAPPPPPEPPPPPRPAATAAVAGTAAASTAAAEVRIAQTEEEIMAQMEEMQAEMDKEAQAARAPAATPAPAAAKVLPEAPEAVPAPALAPTAPLSQDPVPTVGGQPDLEAAARAGAAAAEAATKRAEAAAKKAAEESKAAAAATRPAEKRRRNAAADLAARASRIAAARAARRAPQSQQSEVLLSDGEDDVTAVNDVTTLESVPAASKARSATVALDDA